MSRAFSLEARRAVQAPETGSVFTLLATLTHEALAQPIRIANDLVEADEDGVRKIISRGLDFICCPFQVELPADDGETLPNIQVRIDNVDRQIIGALRAISSPVEVAFEVIVTERPDVIEASFQGLRLTLVEYDALVITGTLQLEDILTRKAPWWRFTPSVAPGLH
ncbi:MAG: DUF1833 domain-containing protein [Azospirillum sp.]|nr:DUF1833 domain-containing protein [Azospirillum sp.]